MRPCRFFQHLDILHSRKRSPSFRPVSPMYNFLTDWYQITRVVDGVLSVKPWCCWRWKLWCYGRFNPFFVQVISVVFPSFYCCQFCLSKWLLAGVVCKWSRTQISLSSLTRDLGTGSVNCWLLFNSDYKRLRPIKGNPRQSWILDSTSWIPDSRYWIPVFVSGTCQQQD